ncbi:uncharacterized protein BCR38DRAFT_168466 [Pseudomassariella vexata]|uniref:Uncharacterized protein n=1 Tax=Pseudomassariella vexata TaxID=1141098 RepID=A0A1Y2E2Y2_9PEZI|nr:uncharacterized protein BCR38DRAFT_168466 [Pseudomassariella vexata]ORY65892.1 hypothetical protein BCR38DRAFT_168466 [Pseudomassariella vexata]
MNKSFKINPLSSSSDCTHGENTSCQTNCHSTISTIRYQRKFHHGRLCDSMIRTLIHASSQTHNARSPTYLLISSAKRITCRDCCLGHEHLTNLRSCAPTWVTPKYPVQGIEGPKHGSLQLTRVSAGLGTVLTRFNTGGCMRRTRTAMCAGVDPISRINRHSQHSQDAERPFPCLP